MQYKVSFLLQVVGHFLGTVVEFFGIWALFTRFNSIGTWTLSEVALFYGMVNISFACADALGRGFDSFGKIIKSGDFDRLLVRPRTTVLQLLGTEFTLKRIGRFSQGIFVTGWSLSTLHIPVTFKTWWLLGTSFIGGVALFVGIVIVQATLTFWTIESLEIMNIVTYGGADVFLTYYTGAIASQKIDPSLKVVGLPDYLSVAAPFGLTVLKNADPNAQKLADYILSQKGQQVLHKYGFISPTKSVPEPNYVCGVLLTAAMGLALKKKLAEPKQKIQV